MFAVTEAEAAAIRAAFDAGGEFSAAVELRRLFPGITDNARARECARIIAGWSPILVAPQPKMRRRQNQELLTEPRLLRGLATVDIDLPNLLDPFRSGETARANGIPARRHQPCVAAPANFLSSAAVSKAAVASLVHFFMKLVLATPTLLVGRDQARLTIDLGDGYRLRGNSSWSLQVPFSDTLSRWMCSVARNAANASWPGEKTYWGARDRRSRAGINPMMLAKCSFATPWRGEYLEERRWLSRAPPGFRRRPCSGAIKAAGRRPWWARHARARAAVAHGADESSSQRVIPRLCARHDAVSTPRGRKFVVCASCRVSSEAISASGLAAITCCGCPVARSFRGELGRGRQSFRWWMKRGCVDRKIAKSRAMAANSFGGIKP